MTSAYFKNVEEIIWLENDLYEYLKDNGYYTHDLQLKISDFELLRLIRVWNHAVKKTKSYFDTL